MPAFFVSNNLSSYFVIDRISYKKIPFYTYLSVLVIPAFSIIIIKIY
jgi:hypothetical protein